MFKAVLLREGKELFSRRNVIILAAVFLLLSLFCWDGINDYTLIHKSIKPFQETENDKVSRHIHYTFYGVRGVRILHIPDPISVIFSDSAVFDDITAHVDSAEKLSIANSFKGKDLFSKSGGYMDFAGLLLIIGAFLGLLYGHDGTRKKDYLKMIADLAGHSKPAVLITTARAILLNLVFTILLGLNFVVLMINGISTANVFYLTFCLVLTLVVTFFVFSGAYIGKWKKQNTQWIALPVVYFLLVLFIPWLVQKSVYIEAKNALQSVYDFEHETYKYIMKLEKRMYERFERWKSGKIAPKDIKAMIQDGQDVEYKKLREKEEKRISEIEKRIKTYQTISAFFPTTFYQSLNKELSSRGFQNFIDFYRYAYDMKFRFILFYIDRKFYRELPKSGVESFIKGNENLYYGESQFPPTVLLGGGITLFYIACLFFLLFRLQEKESKHEVKKPLIDFDTGQTTIIALCKDDTIKNNIFRYYRTQDTAACLAHYPAGLKKTDLPAKTVLRYFSRLAGVNTETAQKYLALLGISDLGKPLPGSEGILKIYAAVKISAPSANLIVLDDFFKMKTRKFEDNFRELFAHLKEQGTKIIYLSCEMPYPKTPMHERINVKRFETYPLDFEKITLR